MEAWDQDFVDEEVEGFFEFDRDGTGEFQFGYVQGEIDYRETSGMASLPSSSPGTATTRWTRRRGGAGRSSTGMRSKGGSSSIGVTTLPSGRSGRGVEP